MQRVNCTVRLSGDVNNTVQKQRVSPAEIVILNKIHGEGSVVDIQRTEMDKTAHAEERQRLATIYGAKIVDDLFPGAFAKLPVSLSDITLGEPANEDPAAEVEIGGDVEPVEDEVEEPAEEDEDDKILRASVENAASKDELRDIAKLHEIDVSFAADRMDALKHVILTGLFPPKKG